MKNFIILIFIFICLILSLNLNGQNISGKYWTNFLHMNLQQSGNQVTGTYESKGGQIDGTLSGRILTGRWSQNNDDSGYFQFEFKNDFSSFDGNWGYTQTLDGGSWHGSKVGFVPSESATLNCHTLFGLGKSIQSMEMAAFEGYGSDFIVTTINNALNHIKASNCLSSSYLVGLKSRISRASNTNAYLQEIQNYSLSVDTEIAESCACCSSCKQ